MQKETNMAVMSRMTCKIGLIWHHMETLYTAEQICGFQKSGSITIWT